MTELPDSSTRQQIESDGAQTAPSASRSPYQSSDWDQSTKRTVVVILLIVMAIILWISRPILPVLVISAIFAYILSPVVDVVERLRIPRSVGTILLFLLLLVGISLLPIFLVPILIRQLTSLSFDAPTAVFGLIEGFNETIKNLPETIEFLGFVLPVSETVSQVQSNYQGFNFFPTVAEILGYIQQLISTATSLVGSTAFIGFYVVGGVVQIVFSVLLVFFLSLYMTKDAPRIRKYIASLFPPSYQSEVGDLLRRMGFIWQSFFRGQIVLSFTIGFMTWAALTVVGMPGALLLGILAGALEALPDLGPIFAMVPAIIIALIQGSEVLSPLGISNLGFALIIVAIYFIIQQLENNILVPRIIGSSVNLHPIIVICGVFLGFQVFGILGALLAAPAIATSRVLGGYIHAKLLGYPPFTDPDVPQTGRDGFLYRRTIIGDELNAQSIAAANSDNPLDPTDDSAPAMPSSTPVQSLSGVETDEALAEAPAGEAGDKDADNPVADSPESAEVGDAVDGFHGNNDDTPSKDSQAPPIQPDRLHPTPDTLV